MFAFKQIIVILPATTTGILIMFVCLCKSVTDHEINDAVDSGVTSFENMQHHLQVATVCGNCTCEVKQLMMKKFNSNLSAKHSFNELSQTHNLKMA